MPQEDPTSTHTLTNEEVPVCVCARVRVQVFYAKVRGQLPGDSPLLSSCLRQSLLLYAIPLVRLAAHELLVYSPISASLLTIGMLGFQTQMLATAPSFYIRSGDLNSGLQELYALRLLISQPQEALLLPLFKHWVSF